MSMSICRCNSVDNFNCQLSNVFVNEFEVGHLRKDMVLIENR